MKLLREDEIAAQREAFRVDLARTIIATAERHPALRGPWVFDEDELQEMASIARAALAKVKGE